MQVGDVTIKVHAHVIEHTSFGLLLGRPFQKAALLQFEDLPNGKVEVSMHDLADLSQRTYLPTRPCTGHVPAVKVISVREPPLPPPSSLTQSLAQHSFLLPPPIDPATLILKYKHIDKKV